MNIINYLIENSDFFNNYFKFTNIKTGKSKTIKYICEFDENKYFIKILDDNQKDNLYKINQIYIDSNVLTPKIIYIEYFKDINKTCVVYEYIKGKSLLEFQKDSSCDELESFGIVIGEYLRKFNKMTVSSKFVIEDLEKELNEMKKIAYQLQKDIKNLPYIDLNRIFLSLDKNKKYVYHTNPKFIHGDVTFNNVIIKNNQPYFIDTDGGKYSFRSLDFKGNWWWTWSGENILKEQSLYRGIYKGLFNRIIPKEFHKELAFTMIYTFLSRLRKYKNNDSEVQFTFLKFKDMFDITNYFEDYNFKWF